MNLLDEADEWAIANGRSPPGAAAGAVYPAGQRSGELITQRAVADEADVAIVTVRKRYRELGSESS